jgi:hypothetical protein
VTPALRDRTPTLLGGLLGVAMLALASFCPRPAAAADPQAEQLQPPPIPRIELETPQLAALAPGAYLLGPAILAKRASDRSFDTSHGEKDPRVRQRPRTHRFRLALASHWVRLTQAIDNNGRSQRFHYAPLYLDMAYQAQFLKYVMVRIAVGVGGNVANSRNAMPVSVFPQAYLGYQGKIAGLAFGYGFDWTIPPTFDAVSPSEANPLQQPVITRNHVVMGELSVTSKIDKVALTFAVSVGGMQSDLSHFSTYNRKWRPYLGFALGGFFDGTKRREKKALKRAEAQGL